MTRILAALAATLSLSTFAAAQSVDVPLPEAVKANGKLFVGVHCGYPPAGYVGLDGKPSGYEITFARKIAEYAFGSEDALETQCVNEGNRIPFLQSGKIDMILASLAYTPARAEQIDYSDPIWASNLQLVVPADSEIRDYKDLAGKTVATPTGSTYQLWLEKCYPDAKVFAAQNAGELGTLLTQGRVDAFAFVDVYAFNFARNQPQYRVAGHLAASAMQGVGLAKGNAELAAWVNAVIEDLRMKNFFFEAFEAEIKDETFVAQYRDVVPGPNVTLDYAKSGALDCN